jgi:hypothetical protein
MITRSDIPPLFLALLEAQGATEIYLTEVNKSNNWNRRKPYLEETFLDFVNLSFDWTSTNSGFFFWMDIAEYEYKTK